MPSVGRSFAAISMVLTAYALSLFPAQIDGYSACPKSPGGTVGTNLTAVNIPYQPNHGSGQTVIVYDPSFTIQCSCGVISAWEVVRYDDSIDGCNAFQCDLDLMVFRNLNVSAMTATLVDYYKATNIGSYRISSRTKAIKINIPRSQYIPVQYGDYLGWGGNPSSVTYYEEPACLQPCPSGLSSTSQYFYGSYKTSLVPGTLMGFYDGPANNYPNYRFFGFRATVMADTAPYFVNLPQTLDLPDTTPVGTVVFNISYSDREPKQQLTLRILWSCQVNPYFDVNLLTGMVTLNRSLINGPTVHTMTIEVSDQCQTNSSDLVITVASTSTKQPSQASAGTLAAQLLRSPAGATMMVITGLATLVSIGTSIAMCYSCARISEITNELKDLKPKTDSKPTANSDKNSSNKINSDRGNPNNQKNESPERTERREPQRAESARKAPPMNNRQQNTPRDITPSPTTTPHSASPSDNLHITPVEQPGVSSSINPSRSASKNYPPRDMLYW